MSNPADPKTGEMEVYRSHDGRIIDPEGELPAEGFSIQRYKMGEPLLEVDPAYKIPPEAFEVVPEDDMAPEIVPLPARPHYLVLDTETSGLAIFTEEKNGKKVTVPADDPRQPWLAQACMIFLDEDFTTIESFSGYVKPDGWVMDPQATAVNGLTTEFLMEHGRPVGEILDRYEIFVRNCVTVVAHNAQFDCKIMRGALRRDGREDMFDITDQFCTMRTWAKHQKTKWPKLIDLCTMLGVHHAGPHKAIADAQATAKLLPHFRRLGIPIEGAVHKSAFNPKNAEE